MHEIQLFLKKKVRKSWISCQNKKIYAIWNGWAARRRDIVFVASGSATSWMIDKLVENQGGLHARITCQIYLRPFTLHETELYLKSIGCPWDRFQIAQCYMFFGRVPFYLSLIRPELSLVQNVDALCFSKGGALREEFDELYSALFTHAESYVEVVRLLATHRGGLVYSEIAKKIGIDGSRLTKILTNLERCDFIMKFRYFGKKTHTTKTLVNTFITAYGVANGIHSSIVNSEVTLDGLFEE